MIGSENMNRLYISVCGVMARKPKDIEAVEFWVGQFRHTADHEVTDQEAQNVVNQIKKVFEIK